MEWLMKLIVAILGFFGLSTLLSAKKSKDVKELKRVIKENKKKEGMVEREIEKLQKNKKKNKKKITSLKRKLTKTKVEVKKMETAFENDDADDAAEFLRKFSKSK